MIGKARLMDRPSSVASPDDLIVLVDQRAAAESRLEWGGGVEK